MSGTAGKCKRTSTKCGLGLVDVLGALLVVWDMRTGGVCQIEHRSQWTRLREVMSIRELAEPGKWRPLVSLALHL